MPIYLSLGEQLRALRIASQKPGREVAAAARIDSTLLSKIETGKRPPTKPQLAAIAEFFAVPLQPLEARRIAEELRRKHASDPEMLAHATAILREEEAAYGANKLGTKASKPAPPVNNRKKMK